VDVFDTDGASDLDFAYDTGPNHGSNKNPTTPTRIPITRLSKLRSPYSSKLTTPYASVPGTPHISRPGTPPGDRPETPGHLPNKPPISRPRTQAHLPSSPPIAKATRQPLPVATRPKAPGSHAVASKPTTKARALRHFKSTPHLTTPKKPHNLLHPATWPPTRSHASSNGKAYTWPGRRNKAYHPATRKPTSSTTSLAPKQPTTPPSICVHTDLSLHWDHRTQIQRYTRYRCKCSPHELRTQRSAASFRWVDGEPLTAYAHAPEKVEWCYCSGGEGHVVRTELEAIERYLSEAEAGRLVTTMRMTEHQRAELDVAEWGGTEKALRKQRECPGLGRKVMRWTRCVWWRKREEGKS
jgi:hypothetical protein